MTTLSLSELFPGVHFKCPSLTNVWGHPVIGEGTGVGAFTEIGDGVFIGKHVNIGAHVFLCSGVVIEDGCFIGPRVTFTNDKYPPGERFEWKPTLVRRGASLGAAVTVLPGVTIGEGATVGAGSVVTHDVQAFSTVAGVPARIVMNDEKVDKLNQILVHAKETEERFVRSLAWT